MMSWLPRDLGRWAGIIAAVALTAGALIASVTDTRGGEQSSSEATSVEAAYNASSIPDAS